MAENKDKPAGRIVEKKDPWSRNSPRGKGTPGNRKKEEDMAAHPAGDGGPEQNAGGPRHHGGDAGDDRNP